MNDAEKLKHARNLIRYILRKCSNELDAKYRNKDDFFHHITKLGKEIGAIDERSPGVFYITPKESVNGFVTGPRHWGKAPSRQKHTLL